MRTPGFDNLAQRDWTPQRSEGAPQGRENATSVFESIPRWSLVRSREVSAGFFVYGGEGSPMRTPGFDNLAQRDWTPQRSEGAPQGRENATSVFESIPRWSLVRSREVSAGFFVYGGEGSPMRTPGGLSDSGTIYCAGGRAAQINPISRYIEPLCASKSCSFGLALPPCSLRLPKADRPPGSTISRSEIGRRSAAKAPRGGEKTPKRFRVNPSVAARQVTGSPSGSCGLSRRRRADRLKQFVEPGVRIQGGVRLNARRYDPAAHAQTWGHPSAFATRRGCSQRSWGLAQTDGLRRAATPKAASRHRLRVAGSGTPTRKFGR